MDFDFQEQYKNLPTEDLLKITLQPGAYPAAAVIAATEILKTREIAQSDKDISERFLRNPEYPALERKPLINSLREFYSYPNKWVNVILTIAVLEYLHLLYNDINSLASVLGNPNIPFRAVFLGSYIDLMFLPIVLYLFYKHNRWGWILMLFVKSFPLVPSLTFYFFDYRGSNAFPPFLIGIALNVALAVLLWRNDVKNIFKISTKIGYLVIYITILLLHLWLLRFWAIPM